jgi:hypothetical protein
MPVTDVENVAIMTGTPDASIDAMTGIAPIIPVEIRSDTAAPPQSSPKAISWRKTWFDKLEAFISSLSVRDHFWQRICSFIWLPYAFFSGIRMKQIDDTTFSAVLPFNRFNRNWYRAMAGAALLGNSEIAGGMYVFGQCGADYMVVCKNMEYKFLRPCFGPAVYRMKPREDIQKALATRQEFNITLDLDILQQTFKAGERERRVGKCVVIFHVTPKAHHKAKESRK